MHRSSPQGNAELDVPRLTAEFRFEIKCGVSSSKPIFNRKFCSAIGTRAIESATDSRSSGFLAYAMTASWLRVIWTCQAFSYRVGFVGKICTCDLRQMQRRADRKPRVVNRVPSLIRNFSLGPFWADREIDLFFKRLVGAPGTRRPPHSLRLEKSAKISVAACALVPPFVTTFNGE